MEKKVVLVTTTFSTDPSGDLRFGMALKTIEAAKRCGYPIIVVDGSPGNLGASEMLERHGAVVFCQKLSGMGNSRREAIRAGLDWQAEVASVIVWLEPEKYPIVPLLSPAIAAVADDQFDLVIPHRKSLWNYPPYQAASETIANQALGAITGRPDLDLYIGPRVMSRAVASRYFLGYDGKFGDQWESIFIPVLHALRCGARVGSVVVDYVHPPEQTLAETGDVAMVNKRDRQRTLIIANMACAAVEMEFFPRLAIT